MCYCVKAGETVVMKCGECKWREKVTPFLQARDVRKEHTLKLLAGDWPAGTTRTAQVKEVADAFGVSERTIWRYLKSLKSTTDTLLSH